MRYYSNYMKKQIVMSKNMPAYVKKLALNRLEELKISNWATPLKGDSERPKNLYDIKVNKDKLFETIF